MLRFAFIIALFGQDVIHSQMQLLFKKHPPSVTALLLQFTACLCIWMTVEITGVRVSLFMLAWLCGILATLLSYLSGLAVWWLAIQLLFVPTLLLLLGAELPPGLFFAAFMATVLVYWSTFRTQVPLYLSSVKVWQALERLLPTEKSGFGFAFLDMGSGLGGVLTYLARARPDGSYAGVEVAPLPYVWSWLRIRLGGYHNSSVHWGSFWGCDLSQYDVVFAYLSPVPMERLWHKARAEMRPGTLFISSTLDTA